MNRRAFLAIAFTCAPLGACGEDPVNWKNDYEFFWRGDHISVYGFDRSEGEACGGSLAFADDYVERVNQYLDFDPETRVDYQWMSPAFFRDKCPPDASSCTASGVARSRDLPQMHEIVHAVTYQNIGVCPSVLEEGLAEYLGNPKYQRLPANYQAELPGDIESMLTDAPLAHSDYRRAGHFVAFLTESYGIHAVVELCAELPFAVTRNEWEQASEAVLGVELDELLDAYAKYPLCTLQQYRARLMECGGSIDYVIEPGTKTEFSVTMDCSEDDVIGPVDGQMIVMRRVWVEQPLYAHVEIKNDAGLYPLKVMATQACAPCSTKPTLNGNVDASKPFALDEGLHAFLFYFPTDQVDTFEVSITPGSGEN